MANTEYYYLHTNGDLIHKRTEPEVEPGGFVSHVWQIDPTDRATAWMVILEGLALGANVPRVKQLAQHWHCSAQDLVAYISRYHPSDLQVKGMAMFLKLIAGIDLKEWAEWITSTPDNEFPNFATMPGRKNDD